MLILFLVCFAITKSFCSDPKTLFDQANKTYRSGDYTKAVELYKQVLKEGYHSSSLYYNLGNSYYKQEDYAQAILNYERARKMNPQDDDILFNLKMANLNTVDKIEPVPQLFYEQWWSNFVNTTDADGWAKLAVMLLWIAVVLAVFYLFARSIAMRKIGFLSSAFALFTFLFLLFVSHIANKQLNDNHAAIIINASAYIKSSPDDKSTNLFMLHGGTRIEILDQLQSWKKIRIANGNVGWVSKEDVEVI